MDDVQRMIENEYGKITNLTLNTVVRGFLEGDVIYAEFTDGDGSDDFCYVFVANGDAQLFDDGVTVIKEFKNILDRRRSFIQRLNEFGLFDLVAAAITFIFAVVFAVLIAMNKEIDSEFVALVTLLMGYLFGKKTLGSA